MIVQVTIERDGATLDALTLGEGEHGIGRGVDNAVVLPDKAVSSHHALLRVRESWVELIDRESLNGIFVNGEKIGKINFTRPVTADICGLQLVFAPQAPPQKRFHPPSLRLGTRPAVLLATAALTLCAFLAAWVPARHALNALAGSEALERGALLARSLAEANTVPLRAKLLDQLRTASVAAEDGVRQAMVADVYGKVLAPPKEMGKILDDPLIGQATKAQGLSLWTTPDGDTTLACPIRDGDVPLGLALVFFKPGQALSPPTPAGGFLLGLLVAALAWGAAAWGLLRLTLQPIRMVAEDIGVALKSETTKLTIVPASREVDELKHAVERALLLIPTSASGQPAPLPGPPAPAVADVSVSDAAGRGQPGPQASTTADEGTWCLLNLASCRLIAWSPSFTGHLRSRDMVPPVHLLAALADPALLAAVAGVVDDPTEDAVRQVENQPLAARKEPGPEPGTVRVRVTESA